MESLDKNAKFQFLKSQLLTYHKPSLQQSKISLIDYSSEQWKANFYKNLESLLTEVTQTHDISIQDKLLTKIEEWFIAKRRMPSIATGPAELDYSTYTLLSGSKSKSPPKDLLNNLSYNSSSSISSHYKSRYTKSYSIENNSKAKITNHYNVKLKKEILSFGTGEIRNKRLGQYFEDYGKNVRKKEDEEKMFCLSSVEATPRLPAVKDLSFKMKIGEEIEEKDKIRNLSTPENHDIFTQSFRGMNIINKFPVGGELLMKLPKVKNPKPKVLRGMFD
ncbi:hypothetical protein SteCoe_32498 [Stentor coeruleus]|uniref:Uncharacterized protein n=1 Tax=Stentor coeruleus TaxID=5963 RepID=A0A1R2AZA6_9CILI|nr:hypothetical protein SteCoe_32498 [Stentor coeruleus]